MQNDNFPSGNFTLRQRNIGIPVVTNGIICVRWFALFGPITATSAAVSGSLLSWGLLYCWTRLAVKTAGWRLWVIICLIIELLLDSNTITWMDEAGSPGTDILFGSGQVSDGLRLICKPTTPAKYLFQNCLSLSRVRLASWPRGDPHFQTLSSMLWGKYRDRLRCNREHLLLKDVSVVALDCAVETRLGEIFGRKERQTGGKALGCFTSKPPILLVIPQYWGGPTPHPKVFCQQAREQGFYVVVFHARGRAACPLTTTRLTEFGGPADLEQVQHTFVF